MEWFHVLSLYKRTWYGSTFLVCTKERGMVPRSIHLNKTAIVFNIDIIAILNLDIAKRGMVPRSTLMPCETKSLSSCYELNTILLSWYLANVEWYHVLSVLGISIIKFNC